MRLAIGQSQGFTLGATAFAADSTWAISASVNPAFRVRRTMARLRLVAGAQKIQPDLSKLTYGQSVTDACIGWDDTVAAITEAAQALRQAAKRSR